jgi:K+-transporting ATPase ATPase C chain
MKNLMIALKMFVALTVITGIIYPLVITGFAQIVFPYKANGSIVKLNDATIGSELIGQKFTSPRYFWGRPSAIDNNPLPSGGSNLSPDSKALYDLVSARLDTIRKYQTVTDIKSVPQDLLFASASGVDPDISPEAAKFQIDRISGERGFNESQKLELANLVDKSVEKPQFGILGEPRVNVLKLNLELDKIK